MRHAVATAIVGLALALAASAPAGACHPSAPVAAGVYLQGFEPRPATLTLLGTCQGPVDAKLDVATSPPWSATFKADLSLFGPLPTTCLPAGCGGATESPGGLMRLTNVPLSVSLVGTYHGDHVARGFELHGIVFKDWAAFAHEEP